MKNYLTIANTSDTNINELISKTLSWRDYGVLYTKDNNIVQYTNNEYSYDTFYLISMIDVEWNKNWYQHDENKLYDYVSGEPITVNVENYSSRIYDKYMQLDKNCYFEQNNKAVFEAINNNSFTMEIIVNAANKAGSSGATIFALGKDSPRNRILWIWGNSTYIVNSIAFCKTDTSATSMACTTGNILCKYVVTIDGSGVCKAYVYNLQTNMLIKSVTVAKGSATIDPETNNIICINKLHNYAQSSYSTNMKFYSLRFYNKCLSNEEINKHNVLDILRFVADSKIEYLESSKTQFINTGINPCMNKIRCVCDMMPLETADTAFFGSRGTYYLFYNVGSNYFWPTSKCETITGTLQINNIYHVDWNKGVLEITGENGVYQKGVRSNATQDSIPMYIFDFNPADSRKAKARIYYFKIYVDDVLVRDFIPVRKDGVGYLLDKVTGALFGNSGTGDFILGPDIE